MRILSFNSNSPDVVAGVVDILVLSCSVTESTRIWNADADEGIATYLIRYRDQIPDAKSEGDCRWRILSRFFDSPSLQGSELDPCQISLAISDIGNCQRNERGKSTPQEE